MTTTSWFPVADHFDVIARHVARTALHGHELVVWRADDGHVNVWENRCLHRGVRLSIGVNDGAELVCRYHAWRYANRSGGCTYIPAHPADSPARTTTCATFPAAERDGLVWASLDAADAESEPPQLHLPDEPFILRSRPAGASAEVVTAVLRETSWLPFGGDGDDVTTMRTVVPGGVSTTVSDGAHTEQVVFLVQPIDRDRCMIRPVRSGRPADPIAAWRHHAAILAGVVERAERNHAEQPVVAAETPVAVPIVRNRADRLRVRIERKWATAEGISAFELVDDGGDTLPVFQPGDHIDVHLPGGLVRQYSLTNGPGEGAHYRIGVKRDPESTGGSAYLNEVAEVGDVLEISAPRNRFALRRNVPTTLLIAGGIGITPILAMAQALKHSGLDVAVHTFVASDADVAFRDVLDRLGSVVHRHVGLDPGETTAVLEQLLAAPDPSVQVAACGPPPMLDAIRTIVAEAGWPDDAVTFESFETGEIDRSAAFTVELARSARTVDVSAGMTVLEAIRAEGIEVSSSCERGVCGTCAVGVLDGDVAHHDVYLTPEERHANNTMLTCVSSAASARLVLDL